MAKSDVTGLRFHNLTVISMLNYTDQGRNTWCFCLCDCGNQKAVRYIGQNKLSSKHCGCLTSANKSEAMTIHGDTLSLTWKRWRSMRKRCTYQSEKTYLNYGARGITVCDRWQDYENFRQDMGDCPGPEYTMERIDNDGNYEPANCRWATKWEQARNRRPTVLLTIDGKTQCVLDWALEKGVKYSTLRSRLSKGWPTETLFGPPLTKNRQ